MKPWIAPLLPPRKELTETYWKVVFVTVDTAKPTREAVSNTKRLHSCARWEVTLILTEIGSSEEFIDQTFGQMSTLIITALSCPTCQTWTTSSSTQQVAQILGMTTITHVHCMHNIQTRFFHNWHWNWYLSLAFHLLLNRFYRFYHCKCLSSSQDFVFWNFS